MSQPQTIADAIKECRQVFQNASKIPHLLDIEWVENRLADFNLWCAGVNASGSGKSSLQARLSTDLETHIFLINLLKLLKAFLERCIELANLVHQSTIPEDIGLSRAMNDVQDTLDQLTRITVAIRKAGVNSRMLKADATFDNENPQIQALRRHLEILVLAKPSEHGTLQARTSQQGIILYSSGHRDVELNPGQLGRIMKRLIDANLRRRNRFLYAQRHANKLSSAVETQGSMNRVALQTMETSTIPVLSPSSAMQESKNDLLKVESTTTATVVQDTIIMPAQHTIQPTTTVLSVTASRVRYPKPPVLNRDQHVFQCPCCCQMLPIAVSRRSLWKKHIARDILPYTCVLDDCSCPEKLYETMEIWRSHMTTDHGGVSRWLCFACTSSVRHPSFDNKDDFIAHVQGQHAKGITAQQIPMLLSAWLRKSMVLMLSCPLCSYTHEDTNAVLSHTAEHVHSFSLKSLPWASTEDRDSNVDGDYFQHHPYFGAEESTTNSMQASSTAESREMDLDLPSFDFEPTKEPNQLTEENLESLNQNPSVVREPAHWLDSIIDGSESPTPSMVTQPDMDFPSYQTSDITAVFPSDVEFTSEISTRPSDPMN